MASMRQGKDFIDHRLHSELNSLHTQFFEERESLFIQGVGSGGDTNGINLARCEERLDFF
jgi:hypothetical protein